MNLQSILVPSITLSLLGGVLCLPIGNEQNTQSQDPDSSQGMKRILMTKELPDHGRTVLNLPEVTKKHSAGTTVETKELPNNGRTVLKFPEVTKKHSAGTDVETKDNTQNSLNFIEEFLAGSSDPHKYSQSLPSFTPEQLAWLRLYYEKFIKDSKPTEPTTPANTLARNLSVNLELGTLREHLRAKDRSVKAQRSHEELLATIGRK